MGVRDLFPKHFFQTARKAISIFEQLNADWMFIGAVSAMPKTEKGTAAKSEGEILCDGDPLPPPTEIHPGRPRSHSELPVHQAE